MVIGTATSSATAVNESARYRDHAQGEKLWTLPYIFCLQRRGGRGVAGYDIAVILAGGGASRDSRSDFSLSGSSLVLTILARRLLPGFGAATTARFLAIRNCSGLRLTVVEIGGYGENPKDSHVANRKWV